MQVAEVEAPAIALFAAMLAHNAVEPAVEASSETEIVPVDGQDERIVENGAVEPVRHDQLDAGGTPLAIGALLPFIDPGKTVAPTFGRLATAAPPAAASASLLTLPSSLGCV